jgi:hypothetical protein
MKTLLPCLFLCVAVLTSPLRAQDVPAAGLKTNIRVTASIPCYLNLNVAPAVIVPGDSSPRLVLMVVQANCPWRLQARLATATGTPGTLREVGTTGPGVAIKTAQAVTVPCQTGHFAGEHSLQFEWVSDTDPALAVIEPTGPVLQLWLEETEPGQPKRTVPQAW